MAMLMASMQNLLVLSVKPQEMGLQTAMNTVFRNVGSSLGAPIAGSILSTFTFIVTFGGVSTAFPTETAFKYTYYVAAAAFLLAFVAALFAREVMGKRAKAEVIEESAGTARNSL
jgi:predicted MFS family arabinose efflux permease